jgi:hypothetical protein
MRRNKETWLNQPLKFEEASHPSDIIWENGHFTNGIQKIRSLVVMLVILVLLGLSFWLIFAVHKQEFDDVKYGNMNCDNVRTVFWEPNLFREEAIDDF